MGCSGFLFDYTRPSGRWGQGVGVWGCGCGCGCGGVGVGVGVSYRMGLLGPPWSRLNGL